MEGIKKKTCKTKRGRKSHKLVSMKVVFEDEANMIESLIFTRGQTGDNVYRQRFLLRLMQLAQAQIRANFDVVLGHSKLYFDQWHDANLEIPVYSVLGNTSGSCYERAKKAILEYASWLFVYEDDKVYRAQPVLLKSELDKDNNYFRFKLNGEVWKRLFDFSKGYSSYKLSIALSLNNEFALKIYKGLEKQKGPIYYKMDTLRNEFGYAKRYAGNNIDFFTKVVLPAQQELNQKSPWTFDVVKEMGFAEGQLRGRKTLIGIHIIPVYQPDKEEPLRLYSECSHPADIIGTYAWHILNEKLQFTFEGVKNNIVLFENAVRVLSEEGFVGWLENIVPSAVRAKTTIQGYVINALKKYLQYKKAVDGDVDVSSCSPVVTHMDTSSVYNLEPDDQDFVEVSSEPTKLKKEPTKLALVPDHAVKSSVKASSVVSEKGSVSVGELMNDMQLDLFSDR